MPFKYHTEAAKIELPEYGRNIQKCVKLLKTIKDREKRNSTAKFIVEVMRRISSHNKHLTDFETKLWTDLFIIARWELDIDTPVEVLKPHVLNEKITFRYPEISTKNRFIKYGRVIQDVITQAKNIQDPELRQKLVNRLANFMKRISFDWRNENISETLIINDLKSLYGDSFEKDIDVDKIEWCKPEKNNNRNPKYKPNNNNRNNRNAPNNKRRKNNNKN